MEKKEKILIVVGVVVILVVVGILVAVKLNNTNDNPANIPVENGGEQQLEENKKEEEYVKVEEDGTKTNISEKIKNEKVTLRGIEFTDMKITEITNRTSFEAIITNPTEERVESFETIISFYDENNVLLGEIGNGVGTMEPGETDRIMASITSDIANTYRIEIKEQ